jgi:Zn-dependent protease
VTTASIIIAIVVVVYSLCLHELAHAWVADRLGDDTPRLMGRVTFNPIPHIDPIYTILIPIIGAMLFGFPFGGARPVRYNPMNFRRPAFGSMLTAGAGPLTNLALGLVGLVMLIGLWHVSPDMLYQDKQVTINAVVLGNLMTWNILLAVLNFIPLPPFDGFTVVLNLLPYEAQRKFAGLQQHGLLLLLVVLFFLGPLIITPAIGFVLALAMIGTSQEFVQAVLATMRPS